VFVLVTSEAEAEVEADATLVMLAAAETSRPLTLAARGKWSLVGSNMLGPRGVNVGTCVSNDLCGRTLSLSDAESWARRQSPKHLKFGSHF
jgi:hypothetical protein